MTTRIALLHALLAASLLWSGGCTVGPDYKVPKFPIEAQVLREGQGGGETTAEPWWRSTEPGLRALIEKAMADNRDVRVAVARLREARALRTEATHGFFPAGAVGAGVSRQLSSSVQYPGTTRDERKLNVHEVGAEASWEVDIFGRVRRAVEANEALSEAVEADQDGLRVLVVADIAANYVDLSLVQAAATLQRRVLEQDEEILRLTSFQVEAGKLGRERLAPAEAARAASADVLAELEANERILRARLGVLTGGAPLPADFRATMPAIPTPVLGGDPERVLGQRPDVRAAERRLAAATAAIGFTRADYFPRLSLSASVGAQATSIDRLDTADAGLYSLGPRLQWDLLNLHRTRARVNAAEARCEQALSVWEGCLLAAIAEIDGAHAQVEQCHERLANRARAATSAGEALRIVSLHHREGRADPAGLHAVHRESLSADLAKLQAAAALAKSVIFLQKCVATDH